MTWRVQSFEQLKEGCRIPVRERIHSRQIRHSVAHPAIKPGASWPLTPFEKWLITKLDDKPLI